MERKGEVNVYTCEKCGHKHVTVNLDDGVTPFLIKCRDPISCHEGMCQSSFYACDQSLRPQWGWYRPTGDDLRALAEDIQEHVSNGGLILRRLDSSDRDRLGFGVRAG